MVNRLQLAILRECHTSQTTAILERTLMNRLHTSRNSHIRHKHQVHKRIGAQTGNTLRQTDCLYFVRIHIPSIRTLVPHLASALQCQRIIGKSIENIIATEVTHHKQHLQRGILIHYHGAWIICHAVCPFPETITSKRCYLQHRFLTWIISSCACHMTLLSITLHRQLVGADCTKSSRISHILRHCHHAWILGITVVPCYELTTLARDSLDSCLIAGTCVWCYHDHLTHAVVAGFHAEYCCRYLIHTILL